MKKLLFVMAAALMSLSAMAATKNANIQFTLSHDGGTNTDIVSVAEVPDFTAKECLDNSSDKLMNSGLPENLNVYTVKSGIRSGFQSVLVQNNITGTIIGVQSNEISTNYTFTVTKAEFAAGHAKLYLYDRFLDKSVEIQPNATYAFTMAVSDTVNNRFQIVEELPVITFEICHQYNALLITGGQTKILVVKNATGAEVINKTLPTTYEEVSLAGLPAGHYTVEINDKVFTIKVQ